MAEEVTVGEKVERMLGKYRDLLDREGMGELWSESTAQAVESIFRGVLACVEDELYLQEFMPYGSIYRLAGELSAARVTGGVPVEDAMQEHILLRDAFWESYKSRENRLHDFAVEKRICQCFNGIFRAVVQTYKAGATTVQARDSIIDRDTGLFNRLYFLHRLDDEIMRSERYRGNPAVLLLELDPGPGLDEESWPDALRAFARVLRRHTRASDVLAHLEESRFAVLMPETTPPAASSAAERLRDRALEYLSSLGAAFAGVGINTGAAGYPEDGRESLVLLEEAGMRLGKGVDGVGDSVSA